MNQIRRINNNRAFKIVYVIGNREVSRSELVDYVAEYVCYDIQRCGIFLMDVANYSKAEKEVNRLYQKAYRNKQSCYVVGSKFESYGVEVKYL